MINTDTDLCNVALDLIGEGDINSIDEETVTAEICKRNYEGARVNLLTRMYWPDVKVYTELAENAGTPPFPWTHWFTLPADYLDMIRVDNNDNTVYDIAGKTLYTKLQAPLPIEYIKDEKVLGNLHVLLREAIAHGLATRIVRKLAAQKEQQVREEAEEFILHAASVLGASTPGERAKGDYWRRNHVLWNNE